jgi:glucosamine-6-phosphate deaminase
MTRPINLITTLKGSLLETFYPRGWNLKKIDACCGLSAAELLRPGKWWSKSFRPSVVADVNEMDKKMGLAIAGQIEQAARKGEQLAMILPVGPMGMYRHVVEQLKKSKTSCEHVTTFNMDEWADAKGNTFPGDQVGGFEHAMGEALFSPLGKLTVPTSQRNFATKKNLPTYAEKIAAIKRSGGKLVTVYGIGRACHIAFWEPHLAQEFSTDAQWRQQTHRVGVALHPLTIEQNAITSFASRFTSVPCFANTIGPGLFLQSDYCVGGCDGAYPDRGAQWQGMSLCVTLQHGPTRWIPSSYMPTMAGELFFLKQLAGPLMAEAH